MVLMMVLMMMMMMMMMVILLALMLIVMPPPPPPQPPPAPPPAAAQPSPTPPAAAQAPAPAPVCNQSMIERWWGMRAAGPSARLAFNRWPRPSGDVAESGAAVRNVDISPSGHVNVRTINISKVTCNAVQNMHCSLPDGWNEEARRGRTRTIQWVVSRRRY